MIEIAVEHPNRVIAAGNIFLQDYAGRPTGSVQVEDFKQVLLARNDSDPQAISPCPQKFSRFALYDDGKTRLAPEANYFFPEVRRNGSNCRNVQPTAQVESLSFADKTAHDFGADGREEEFLRKNCGVFGNE